MRKILLLASIFLTTFTAFAQDQSNKGRDFWFAYPAHNAGTTSRLAIYLTSNLTTSGTVTFNGNTIPFSVVANQTAIVKIGNATTPSNATCYIGSNNIVEVNKGIRIQSVEPVAAYAHILNAAVSGSTLLLPVPVLGKEYIVASHVPQGSTVNIERCQFVVVGVVNNTTVEITPTSNDVSNTRLAGVTYQIVLNAGDVYQFQSLGELSGSVVKSIASGMGICQRIVVIGSTTRSAIGCPLGGNPSSGDNLFLQLPPKTAWGKRYLTAPFILKAQDKIRVFVSKATTPVNVNGTDLPLGTIINNAYYEFNANTAQEILSADPIAVYQYIFTQNCDGVQSDPEMIYINPVEQTIKDIAFVSAERDLTLPRTNITSHYLNLILKNSGTSISSLTIDGAAPATTFTPIAATGYSYARINLTSTTTTASPSHRVINDSGFIAIAYGYGNVESYGYNAGTNVRDLNTRLEISNPNSIDPDPSACTNSPFQFKVYFADSTTSLTEIRYDSIQWEVLANASNLVPNNFPVMVRGTVGTPPKVVPDSVNIRNGKYVAWYSLPGFYYATAPGVYPIRITLYKSTNEGCGNSAEYPFDLTVTDPPTASFSKNTPGCYLETVVVTETTPQLPKATYKLWWEFYDPVTNATTVVTGNGNAFRTATHTFTTPGTIAAGTAKRIRHASITTPGCLSDTITQFIELPRVPDGTIAGNTAVCTNAPNPDITVTMIDGQAPYRFSYTINGTPQTPIVSPTGTYTISVPTTTPGTYVYELTEVRNNGSTVCIRNITGQTATVIVRPLPNAAIGGATTVCLNSTPLPNVTFTGSNATAPYTFAYTINGVPQTPVVSNGAGIATVSAPTNVVGTFIYEITQVTDGSSTTCSSNITGTTTTITVQNLPNAAIASSTTAVCQNATQPTVTFTGSGGTALYTFNYTINGVAQTPVVSNAAGVATLNVPTTTVGSFIYEITQVTEGSGQACVSVITGQTVTVTVNPLPNAAIAGAITVCLNSAPDPVVTFTGSNATAPYTFAYTINAVPQTPVVSNAAGIATVNAPTTVVGTFIYAVTQVTDASSTACSRPISGTSTTITIRDLPNGVIAGSTTAACLNSAPLPTITFTGSTGTAPYTFTYTINGVTQPTVISNGAGVATITVPTNVATTYTYELTAVSEASTQLCARTITGQTWVVVINPLPVASVTGAIEVCKDAPQPTVTFTGSGATAPYTFEYTINGTAQTPLVSNAVGVATVLAPTNVAGTFTYQLTRVTDASSTTCSQLQNGSTIITVNQLPTAAFTSTAPRCETRVISFTDASVPNIGTLTNWTWDFGDGPPTSSLQNPTHVYASAGTYTVTLTVTNSKGCISNPIASIPVTINNRPAAGYIIPEVCLSDTYAQFWDTSSIAVGAIVAWEWYFDDPFATPANPNTSNLRNPTHSYTAVGLYDSVQLIVTSALGCRDTIVQSLTVNGSFPVANFNVLNPTTLCANDSVAIVEASTVFPGVITKIEIWWDDVNAGPPAPPEIDNLPFTGKVYKHLYPNFQTPLTRTYRIRYRAYSGGVCLDDSLRNITVNAAPLVQFNNMPDTCLLVAPFQLTQASEIGGVPGSGVYSGPGVSSTGIFFPQVAGVGTHTLMYTFTSTVGGCVDTMSNTIIVLDTAHAQFSFVTPICENTAASFTDLSTAPAGVTLNNTVWNFGDGTPVENHAPGSTFTHVFINPGTFTVTMYNVSAYGCNSTVTTQTVVVDSNHTISLSPASGAINQTRCINTAIAPIIFILAGGANNATVTGLPAGVTATVTGGNTLTISGSPTTTVGSPFMYTIVTTGNTCNVARDTGTISVNPDHTIALRSSPSTTNQSVCVNTAIDNIVYDLGGGANNVTITGLPAGLTYTVVGTTLTITGSPNSTPPFTYNYAIQTTGNICIKANAAGVIKVNPYPVPHFTVDKPSYCIPNAIVGFINGSAMPDASGMTYLWNFGDGSPLNPTVNPSHWYASAGPFNVKLAVRSTAVLNGGVIGCEDSTIIAITTIHPQPKTDFTFSKPSICIGTPVTITDNTDYKDGIADKWNWKMGDGTTNTNNPVTYLYADTITYNVTLYTINNFGCNSDTLTKAFTVYPYPHVNAGPDRYILEGGQITLESVTFANDPLYLWTPNLYLNDNKIARPKVIRPLTDMTYRLTVTARGGCERFDDVFVKLLKFPLIPNTFTPNNDNIHDDWRIEYLNTYPNNRVQVFTRTGQLVFESRGYNTPWNGTLKGKPLPMDTYYYIIEPGNGRDPITGYVTIIK